jgi:hypothetical protein
MGAAAAANTRSFVSASSGSDSNPCTRADPCRSFQTAYANTVAGGEINTLDPGGYGALTINHSISVVSGLGEAGVLVPPSGDGITINAGPTDRINLRGLIVEGAGAGSTGIVFIRGGSLTISNVVVRNNVSSGIAAAPTNANARLVVSNSQVNDNGGHGIYVQPAPASDTFFYATFKNVEAYNNSLMGIGIFGNYLNRGGVIALAMDCLSAGNGDAGYGSTGNSAVATPTSFLTLYRSAASGNVGFGAYAIGRGRIIAEQSHIDTAVTNDFGADPDGVFETYNDSYAVGSNVTNVDKVVDQKD